MKDTRPATEMEWQADAVRPLTQQEFAQIRELAYSTFGLDLKAGKEELVSARLRRLVKEGGFRSFQEYCQWVRGDRTGEALAAMVDALATNHTSFLREPDHFQHLIREVLPTLAGRERIDVWSAACSTGEEVWTLAFLLTDALPSRQIRITATDISQKALRFAERATYSAERCQGLSATWLSRYCLAQGKPVQTYTVKPQIRALASFRRLNLVEGFTWPKAFPVIFCRNVMIYFDRKTQERVVERLTANLEPGGHLFVGHAESLARISHSLEYVRPAVYRKTQKRGSTWTKSS